MSRNPTLFEYEPEITPSAGKAADVPALKDVELPVHPVSRPSREELGRFAPRVAQDYEDFKIEFLTWMATDGKNPTKREGYADTTIQGTHYRIDKIFRSLWNYTGDYTTELTEEAATELIVKLVQHPEYDDNRILKYVKSIKRLFKFYNQTQGRSIEWDHGEQLTQEEGEKNRDYFRPGEMRQLYNATLELGTVRAYHNCSPAERDKIKAHLAQRYEKKKSEVTEADFDRANSWKWPALYALTLDCGLRPIEVERSKKSWLDDLEEQKLVIPKEDSAKEKSYWECAVSSRTVRILKRWMGERERYELYHKRDELWLTRHGNPYTATTLNRNLKHKVLPLTEIEPRGRELTWYAIRRGVATQWANTESIHDAKEQLRHKKLATTIRYVKSSPGRRTEMAEEKW